MLRLPANARRGGLTVGNLLNSWDDFSLLRMWINSADGIYTCLRSYHNASVTTYTCGLANSVAF